MNQNTASKGNNAKRGLAMFSDDTLESIFGTPNRPKSHHGPASDGTRAHSGRTQYHRSNRKIAITGDDRKTTYLSLTSADVLFGGVARAIQAGTVGN